MEESQDKAVGLQVCTGLHFPGTKNKSAPALQGCPFSTSAAAEWTEAAARGHRLLLWAGHAAAAGRWLEAGPADGYRLGLRLLVRLQRDRVLSDE